MINEYFDKLETRDAMTRSLGLQMELPKQIAHARDSAAAYTEILADVDPQSVTSLSELAGLPVTRKSDLIERQSALKPFCLLYTSPSPRDKRQSRMPSSA